MDIDIAIVGGGPAGIATALFFAAAAPHLVARIVILEKERYPREKICAGAVGARADRLLETIGVHVDVPSVPVHGFSVVSSRGARVAAERGAAPIGRVVRRVEFDAVFAAIARARGVRVLEGARVSDVAVDDAGVRLRLGGGEELRARAVVGADGVGSVVRRAVSASRGGLVAQVVEADTPAVVTDHPRDLLHFDLCDGSLSGYGWDFPTLVEGRPLVCRGLYDLRMSRSGGQDLGARLRARLRSLGLDDGVRVKRYALRGVALADPFARPRALLVGEAAGTDPVLGEGIAQAIFYGAVAGPYLARCLERGDLCFASFRRELLRSRVGLDLRVRARLAPWIYGRCRPIAERWVAGSAELARAGMRYFAGERVPRGELAGAAAALFDAAAREAASVRLQVEFWSGHGHDPGPP